MQERFPELKLPSLPRKFHIFMKDSDVDERQIAFDCLLKVILYNNLTRTSPLYMYVYMTCTYITLGRFSIYMYIHVHMYIVIFLLANTLNSGFLPNNGRVFAYQ